MELQRKKNPIIIIGYEPFLFFFVRNSGKQASLAIRYIRPLTPTNEVSTAPAKTAAASKTTIYCKIGPPIIFAASASKKSFAAAISVRCMLFKVTKEIKGLKIATPISILRSVFRNTPFSCSSTKLAELSNPDTPNNEVENAKNKVCAIPPFSLIMLPVLLRFSKNKELPFK